MATVGNSFPVSAKKYGKVIITLDNVLIPVEKLKNSPSLQDGLDPEIELDLRILGCELIQTSGILLKLPQVAMATGQVLFQRFYYAKSLVRYPMETTAMACVALASKIEEAPMKIRDVINVFNHIKQVKNGKTIQPVILDSNYIALKNQVVKAERRLLKELGFCCHVKHPHKIIIMYLRLLEAEHKKLAQSSCIGCEKWRILLQEIIYRSTNTYLSSQYSFLNVKEKFE
ncbi:Cyclin-L1 [Armadillidium nasatum]|uniref:Cyclin-L1 n=1 Tax=Armadillidium nasatum TaxID=96803 RepID=A0A5N5T7Q3_9CRUS|nr:Cyclin-L1 [Armadillidium nasatum]